MGKGRGGRSNNRRGRPKKNWLTFEEARDVVRDECIESVSQYLQWYDWHRPKQIPKYPYRVYSQWTSWNDFLGNENVFDKKIREIRPFVEAVAWTHKLQLRSAQAWFQYIRENGIPKDIPAHPELYYDQWISWNHWLGNTASAKVAARQEIIHDAGILYIVHIPGRPANVFKIGVELGGVSAIRDAQQRNSFRVIKLFKMEAGFDWKAAIAPYGKVWWENDSEFVINNINQLVFELSSDLLFA